MSEEKLYKLRDCPMCGGGAKIIFNDHGNREYIARCNAALTCGTRGSAWKAADESAKAWNRRAIQQY